MKSKLRAAQILAVMFGAASLLGPGAASAQQECYDCFDDTSSNEHRMSFFEVDWGWFPGYYHVGWSSGYCFWQHSRGCVAGSEEAAELAATLPLLEGKGLSVFLQEHGESLEIPSDGGWIGVKGCGGGVAYWVKLSSAQAMQLASAFLS
jgi:hypothetical protein